MNNNIENKITNLATNGFLAEKSPKLFRREDFFPSISAALYPITIADLIKPNKENKNCS